MSGVDVVGAGATACAIKSLFLVVKGEGVVVCEVSAGDTLSNDVNVSWEEADHHGVEDESRYQTCQYTS